jgi:hypothetical protein
MVCMGVVVLMISRCLMWVNLPRVLGCYLFLRLRLSYWESWCEKLLPYLTRRWSNLRLVILTLLNLMMIGICWSKEFLHIFMTYRCIQIPTFYVLNLYLGMLLVVLLKLPYLRGRWRYILPLLVIECIWRHAHSTICSRWCFCSLLNHHHFQHSYLIKSLVIQLIDLPLLHTHTLGKNVPLILVAAQYCIIRILLGPFSHCGASI